jgi:hypothetical protein
MDDNKNLQHKKRAFLAAYAEIGNITRAAELANISRQSHYEWLRDDPNYPALFRSADEQASERLEQEARRRAVEGVEKPVFHKGEVCGTIREYSDTLLIFLLKGAKPEKYHDRVRQEMSGPNGGPIETKIDMSGLTVEELKQLAQLE